MRTKTIYFLFVPVFLFFLLAVAGCKEKKETLFQLLPAEKTNISFANNIYENDTFNILALEYVYNGGGVAVGDFDNDGLQDLYFTGNMVPNKLYMNRGSLTFEDITDIAGVGGGRNWSTGVALVDINNDSWLDIYVCASVRTDSLRRKNLLYINNGPDDKGNPVFKESAEEYGIADTGYSTFAAFFDYDLDGDADLYVLTNQLSQHKPSNYRKKSTDGSAKNNDRLYRNNGNGTFTNVTGEAGILIEGYGLGLAISDINQDGWPDVYVANDFLSEDLLYINNQDGTFSNKIKDYIKHTSASAMGNSVTDINNDGLVDILAMDMLPEPNLRKKTMLNANNYVHYVNNEKFNIQHQYIRNTLQLNNGNGPDGHPVFSEIGQLSGIYHTDWSWAPLVADFDNDGWRDLIVTNGFPRDVTDHDFILYRGTVSINVAGYKMLVDSIPVVKISNYGFRNNGDLTFTDKTEDWGLKIPSFSNGGIYADLDNDGDLEVVVNNINEPALVFENRLYNGKKKEGQNNYIRIKPEGNAADISGTGTKISIHYGGGKQQFYEHTAQRGYLSTVEAVAHFGLGTAEKADSVQILWPDGRYQLLRDIPANQQLIVRHNEAVPSGNLRLGKTGNTDGSGQIFKEVSDAYGISYKPEEEDKIDFNLQRTLPHKYSQSGPGLAVADVDGDGLEDFYVGGAAGKSGALFMQNHEGKFSAATGSPTLLKEKPEEDMGALFFDANSDGAPDLYIVSGSYEFKEGAPELQDRLFINNGKGEFEHAPAALPQTTGSGAAVKAADFDKDGDLDLFVSGRVVPGKYPLPAQSYLLRNDDGKFTDVTSELAPELQNFGLIADALWTDFDQDGQTDLIVAAEWQPLSFFKNTNGTLKNVTTASGVAELKGWWNSIVSGDYDGDGDMDYIVGNLGLNTHYKANQEQPLSVYAKDYDNDGRFDAVLSCYMKAEDGQMKSFPMHTRDDLIVQMIGMRRKFPQYKEYGKATIDQVLSKEDLEGALILEANHFATTYFENKGNGTFKASALPVEAQTAPVFGMLSKDFDGDGHPDVLLTGNNYGSDVFTGRYDAFKGLFLKGNGAGDFEPKSIAESGFFVDGDAKGIAGLFGKDGEQLLLVSQNKDSLKVFTTENTAGSPAAFSPAAGSPAAENILLELRPLDARAELIYRNGKREKQEFYYGSSFLSQSGRRISLSKEVVSVTIYNFKGESRTVSFGPEQSFAEAVK